MADELENSVCYTLKAKPKEDRKLLFFKLTDSASQAIEDCVKAGSNITQLTVAFEGSAGVLNVPLSDGGAKEFRFAISNISETHQQGSFDCVLQNDKNQMESIGNMIQKITIHANDDVYKTTRDKMTEANDVEKKIRTKQIKAGEGVGRKSKINPNPFQSKQHRPSSNEFKKAPSKKTEPVTSHSNGVSAKHSVAVGSKPLRERIIHLLAVRPYSRPDMLLRLQKDGISEREKEDINSVLEEVGVCNPTEKTYSLAKHLYKTAVNPNWTHYSETDRQVLKRLLSKYVKDSTPNSDNSSKTVTVKRKPEVSQHAAEPPPPKKPKPTVPYTPPARPKEPESIPNSVETITSLSSSESGNDSETDYETEYGPIQLTTQRQQYIQEYNKHFPVYNELYKDVKVISEKFDVLADQLRECEEKYGAEGEQYEKIKQDIVQQYTVTQSNPSYNEKRKKLNYLHHKLSHIKQMVKNYDERVVVS